MNSSIFNPDPFFNSPFAEEVTYTSNGDELPPIKAIVSRLPKKSFAFKKAESQSILYPYEIMIQVEDVNTVIPKHDRVVIFDKGVSKTVVIQQILPTTDQFTWVLGAI